MRARLPLRHLTVHFGGAIAAVLIACAVPAGAAQLLGPHRASLLLFVPVAAGGFFLAGFVRKVARWMRSPVPFRIPLTVGQQRALRHIAHDRLGNPHSAIQAVLRTAVDVVLFRPLLRSTPTAGRIGRGLGDGSRWLWMFSAAFHGSLAIVLVRHLRLLLTPVPSFVSFLERVDTASEIVLPKVHATSVLVVVGIALLLGRRLVSTRVRYISLMADYFPLLLLSAIAITGLLMRHVTGSDVPAIKEFGANLARFTVVLPARADALLVVHVFLVGVLLVYFPLSKLMHVPGAFMSPTLTLANDNRAVRHVNVVNPQVQVLHYADYEATFRDRMIEAGLPVEEK